MSSWMLVTKHAADFSTHLASIDSRSGIARTQGAQLGQERNMTPAAGSTEAATVIATTAVLEAVVAAV